MIEVAYTLKNRGVARLSTVDLRANSAAAFHSALDDSLEIQNHQAVRQFYGRVATVNDRAAPSESHKGVISAIEGVDLMMAIDSRIIVNQAYATQSRKALVTAIVADKLAVFGITVDAGMSTGATIDGFTFTGTVKDVFDQVAAITNEIWRLTPALVLEFFAPGAKTAPYSLTSTNGKILGGVKWVKTRKQMVNRLLLSYGGSGLVSKTWSVAGDGVAASWTLDYPGAQDPTGRLIARPVVADTFFGGEVPLGVVGIDPTNWYEFNPATNQIIRIPGALPSGHTASLEYSVQFPQTVEVSDSASIAANGPWDAIQSYDATFDKDVALAEAQRRLARYKSSPRTVSVKTQAGLVLPGDVITLTIPERTISGSWLITQVTAKADEFNKFTYDLTCVEGTEAQDSWIDQFRQITGGGSTFSGGALATGSTTTGYLGSISGSGTTNTLPRWASSTTLGDSLIREGTGNPEGAITAPPASMFLRTDTGSIYRKASGSGNTGWTALAGLTLLSESGNVITAAGHFVPSLTDTWNLGRHDLIWNEGFLSQLNAILFALNTQTLMGGYSTIGFNAGSFAAAVFSGATTINFGTAMTNGHFVLVRAHDTGGNITAEYLQVGTLVSGTTYNVTRNLSGLGAKNWAQGTPFLVLGTTGTGRIDLLAYDGKPRIQFVEQGATYNAQSTRAIIGNLNTYYGYSSDLYGFAAGNPSAANITIDATNGIRIRHSGTNKITLDASGNAAFDGEISATSGAIGGFAIASTSIVSTGLALQSGAAGSSYIVVSDTISNHAGIASGSASSDIGLWTGATHPSRSTAPFRVTFGGALTATNANISGTVTASAGSIGGFDIGSDYIRDTVNSFGMASTVTGGDDVRFWAGATFANRGSAPFIVTESGAFLASNAAITGNITANTLDANGGTMGGLTVDGSITIGSGGTLTAGAVALHPTTGITITEDASENTNRAYKFSNGGGLFSVSNLVKLISAGNNSVYVKLGSSGDFQVDGGGSNAFVCNMEARFGGQVLAFIGSDTGTNVVLNGSSYFKTDSSSVRGKENIRHDRPTRESLDALLALEPIRFDYKDGGTKNVLGFAAEDLHAISPDLVNVDAQGLPTSIRYAALCAYLLSAIKETRASC